MRHLWNRVCSLIVMLAAVASASANPTVIKSGSGSLTNVQTALVNGTWEISFTASPAIGSNDVTIIVEVDGDDKIRFIEVESNDADPNDVLTTRVSVAVRAAMSGGRLLQLERFEPVSNDGIEDGEVSLTVTTNLSAGGQEGNLGVSGTAAGGLIKAHDFGNLIVRGNVTASIIALASIGTGVGDITSIRANGLLVGNITANGGDILDIGVDGRIGSASNSVTITAGKSIRFIKAGELHADLSTGSTSFVQRIETTGAGTTNGDFTGSVSTKNLTCSVCTDPRGIVIAGDMDADLSFTNGIFDPIMIAGDLTGSIDAGSELRGLIKIGGSLTGTITTAAMGLTRQVVVNASDAGKTWSGSVTVGTTTLSPVPSYDNLPSTIGGGAVGVGPFKFHAKACEPDHQSGMLTGPGTPAPSEARMEFYGELIDNSGANEPVKVERKSFAQPSSWEDVTSNDTIAVSGRVVTVTPQSGQSFGPNFKYRITPVAGRLSSKDVDGTPDVDRTPYEFDVEAAGPGA